MENPEKMVQPYLTKMLYHKAELTRTPLSGTFELSPVCNFNCRMCYIRKTKAELEDMGSEHSPLTYGQWISIAEQAKKEGLLFLLLTGGEPLLWPDFWKLYETLHDMGFLVGINTNGSMIDSDAIERWKIRPPYRVNLTLYGDSDETYRSLCGVDHVCQKVKSNIIRLKEAGILVKLNCSLTPHNADDLKEMIAFSESVGVPIKVTTYMFPPVRKDESMIGLNDRFSPDAAARYHIDRYRYIYGEEKYKDFISGISTGLAEPVGLDDACTDPEDGSVSCTAGRASFWITWDGYMTPCGMMPIPKVSIRNQAFKEVWDKIADLTEKISTSGVCSDCPNRKICHSCAAMAYAETGSTSGIPHYLCEMIQSMKEYAVRELQKDSL